MMRRDTGLSDYKHDSKHHCPGHHTQCYGMCVMYGPYLVCCFHRHVQVATWSWLLTILSYTEELRSNRAMLLVCCCCCLREQRLVVEAEPVCNNTRQTSYVMIMHATLANAALPVLWVV